MTTKQQIKDRITKLQNRGVSFSQACMQLGVARSTAWDWLNDRKRNSCESSTDNTIKYDNKNTSFVKREQGPSIFIKNRYTEKREENYENILEFI